MNQDERMAMTRAVMELLDDWGLQASDMIKLLDLPASVKARNIGRYRDDTPFPEDDNVLSRLQFILRIADALRTYFPRNPEMRNLWVRRGNRRFGKDAPLAVMVEQGESGLVRVLSHLDCTYAWDQTGSSTTTVKGV